MSGARVPFFDRTRGDAALEVELVEALLRLVRGGHYVLGPEVDAFEAECAAYLGVPHAIGVSSGTDALLVALMALDVGPGDEVVCPAYTFFATAGAIARTGAKPVLADILPGSFNLDPRSAARAITPRTRAVVAVHLFGQCAAMDELLAVAAARDLPVIEDAAQAFGAARAGRRAGGLGAVGCFSFFPTKNLGGFGDGGLVTTARADLADRVRLLRGQGARPKHHHVAIGGNFRLDALQAALLRRKLPRVDEAIARRREHAARYAEGLAAIDPCRALLLPFDPAEGPPPGHTFNQLVLRLADPAGRDALRASLDRLGIATEVYYPAPLHLQPCFAGLGHPPGSLPVAELAARSSLALPIFPELSAGERARVIEGIAAHLVAR